MTQLPTGYAHNVMAVAQSTMQALDNDYKVSTFQDGCKQGIGQQPFNRKSISRKITHPLY